MALFRFNVNLDWPGTGGPGINQWDLRTTGSADPEGSADLDTLVSAIGSFYSAISAAIFPAGYSYFSSEEAVEVAGASTVVPVPSFGQTVTGSDPMGPTANQMILTIRTSTATRRGRGRKFLGPVALNTIQSDGTPTQGVIGDVQSAADALVGTSQGFANGAVGVYSGVDGVFRDVTSMQCRNYFAVLRSRRD